MIKIVKTLACATVLSVLSIAAPGIATAQDTERPSVGVLIYNVGQDPWLSVAADTFQKKGEEMGFDVSFMDGRNDIATMNAAINQFVIQGVDAIIVQPADPDSLVGSVLQARQAEIPVVAFSHNISPDAKANAHVGADEVEMGREQARLVVDALSGKGKVAIMMGILGTTPQLGRLEGQREVFDAEAGIEIVEMQANDWQHEKTVSLIQNWLSKYPKGELDAVLAHGPELVAAAEYARSQGRDEILFVALDYPEDARQAIIEGSLYGTINQSPATMAEKALETVATLLDGGTVEQRVLIDTPTVTKENVEGMPAAY